MEPIGYSHLICNHFYRDQGSPRKSEIFKLIPYERI